MSHNQPLAPGANPFTEQINPYAAPAVADPYAPKKNDPANPFAGLWREGSLLVMHKEAPLPDICLKSNEPATRRLKRSLSWHPPAYYLLVLLHILIYVVVALLVRKTATIYIPLTDDWYARRQRRMLFAWGTIFACIGLFVAGVAFIDRQPWAPWAMIGAIVLALAITIYGLVACRMVWPKRMTDQYIWLKGVHPEYLNRLEVWQWNL
jgi:hypothetical protein